MCFFQNIRFGSGKTPAYTTQEDLIEQKKRVDLLSKEAKKSYELLMQLCNEIYFTQNLNSGEKDLSEADKLIYVLTGRIVNHLTSISYLVSAYEEYFKILEKLNPQVKMGEE